MMLWMVYSLLVAVLLTLAAHGAERVLRLHGRPTRWVWLSAILLSFALPALLPWLIRVLASDGAGLFVPSATISLAAPALIVGAAPSFSWSSVLQIGVALRERVAGPVWRVVALAAEPFAAHVAFGYGARSRCARSLTKWAPRWWVWWIRRSCCLSGCGRCQTRSRR